MCCSRNLTEVYYIDSMKTKRPRGDLGRFVFRLLLPGYA